MILINERKIKMGLFDIFKNKETNTEDNLNKNENLIYFKDLNDKLLTMKSADGWGIDFKISIDLLGGYKKAKLIIRTENEISDMQRNTYSNFIEKWNDNFQTQIIERIIKYYNEEEKFSYGPEDEEELNEWFPEINTVEKMLEQLELEDIIIPPDYLMKNGRCIYLTFNHKWGHDIEYDMNGIGIELVNEKITEIGYKSIAY